MEDLRAFLSACAQGDLLPWAGQAAAADRFLQTVGSVEEAALELGLMPARYQRNRLTISIAEQRKLFRSRVVIVGAGGLGGYIIEELARLGVGTLVVVDPDTFEEHNLNRQLLGSLGNLGVPKVQVAVERVGTINPAVRLVPLRSAFSRENGPALLSDADAVVDALDTVTARVELARACRELGVPMVHGAIAGWYGQMATQMPGEDITPFIYPPGSAPKGVETKLGNPSFTPAVVASLQVAEVCKILLGQGRCLNRRMLFLNLLEMEFEDVPIASGAPPGNPPTR
ncbi:MAG TPA: HesA/MoeB/ThiF family protein [Desulfobacteria bacterium]|nr:HesA/MoeB/ThiF family protein [Desulfobacteria bacterium]